MADERLTGSLQESVLTLLAFDDDRGRVVANMVKPELFEGLYRDLATRILEFRQRFKVPPGQGHLDDIFADKLDDPKNREAAVYRDILLNMVSLSKNYNAEYITDQISVFVRRQQLKLAVVAAGDRYQAGQSAGLVEDVERILYDALKNRTQAMSSGLNMADPRALDFLDRVNEPTLMPTGIEALDRRGLGAGRKKLWVNIGVKKAGKTWMCTYLAKRALLANQRVLHITLEMPEEDISQRYFQSMFAISKRDESFRQSQLELDKLGHVCGLTTEEMKANLNFSRAGIKELLYKRQTERGALFKNLQLKAFPSGTLTMNTLLSYLDYLDTVDRFLPDLMIIDYPDLMWVDPKDYRLGLGRLMVGIRGIAAERNLAVIAPKQSNREGDKAEKLKGHHIAEDISAVATADLVTTLTRTDAESNLGLARLYVSHARTDEDKFTVLLTQNYHTGQFMLQSVQMNDSTWDNLKGRVGELSQIEEEGGDDD